VSKKERRRRRKGKSRNEKRAWAFAWVGREWCEFELAGDIESFAILLQKKNNEKGKCFLVESCLRCCEGMRGESEIRGGCSSNGHEKGGKKLEDKAAKGGFF
jgi:hypothetical protein